MYANVIKGGLKLKKKKRIEVPIEEGATDAERRHKKRSLAKQKEVLKEVVKKTHRERVDDFNEKLGSLTEHNDIPRISAAGNG